MQYVKIRYSIDMEEVPKKIFSLLEELERASEECPKSFKKIVDSTKDLGALGAENISAILEEIDTLRHSLYQVDMRLGDCSQMLRGYQRASVDGAADDEEIAFEPHDTNTDQYDEGFREQVKQKVTAEVMADFKKQMDDVTNSWRPSKDNIDVTHQEAIDQLPPSIQSMIAAQQGPVAMPNMPNTSNGGEEALSGQANLMKSMMEKMMKGEIKLPPNKK